jgi:hypothetical protein
MLNIWEVGQVTAAGNRRLPDGGDQDKKQRPSSCEFLFVLGFFICRLKHQTTTMLEIWFFACVSQNKGL